MTPLELARGALASLEANRQRIDDLNVYPVPDGDTGTNLTLTARAIADALETTEQAEARIDKGAEAARTALEMADLFAQLRASAAAAT